MIEAKELRIGNLVLYGCKTMIIDEINSDGTIEFDDSMDKIRIIKVQPITLTEEILLKCGFKKDENEMFVFSRKVIYKKNDNTFHFYGCDIEIKYLHQLQNLYFALTGQELEINL